MPAKSSRTSKPHKQTWQEKILYWLYDQRKLGKSEGSTVTASAQHIAEAVGTYRRQAILSLRWLEKNGYIEVTRRQKEDNGDLTNKITTLPMNRAKRDLVIAVAENLGVTKASVIMMLDKLVDSNKYIPNLTLDDLSTITGWQGDPLSLANALIGCGAIKDGILQWN